MTKVAACQVAPVLADPAANRDLVAESVRAAAAEGAQIVVLPELVSSGYAFVDPAEALAAAEAVDGPTLRLWQRLASEHRLVVVGGFCEDAGGERAFNSAAILDHRGVLAVYRKAHLWDRERLVFTAGSSAPPVVETEVGRVSAVICYDLEFPEWVRLPALAGAQLVAAPVNWPDSARPPGERPGEVVRVQADAAVNRVFVVACDRVGTERGVEWVGGSVITDADGWVLAGGWATTSPAVLVADVDLAAADDKGVGGLSDIHRDRRPDLYTGH